jgi:hypothetical protein
MSLTGPSAHRFVTLAFIPQVTHGHGRLPALPSLKLRQPTPIPGVGDIVMLPQTGGGLAEYQVLERRYQYPDETRCTVTLTVSDAKTPV